MQTFDPIAHSENDGLPLEYKLMYGAARRYLSGPDIIDDAASLGAFGVNECRLKKQLFDFGLVCELASVPNDSCDLNLISAQAC